jgi:hypothetical protein
MTRTSRAYTSGFKDGAYLREIGEAILAGQDPDGLLRTEYLREMEKVIEHLPPHATREATFTTQQNEWCNWLLARYERIKEMTEKSQ